MDEKESFCGKEACKCCESAVRAKKTAESELLKLQNDCEAYKKELSEKAETLEENSKDINMWMDKYNDMGGLAEKLEQKLDGLNSKYVKSVALIDQYKEKLTSLRSILKEKATNDPIIEDLLKSPEIKKRVAQMKFDTAPIDDPKIWPKQIDKPNPDLPDRGVLDPRIVHSKSIPAPYAHDAAKQSILPATSLLRRSSRNLSAASPSNSARNVEPAATTVHSRKGKMVQEQQAEDLKNIKKVAKMRGEENSEVVEKAGISEKTGEKEPTRHVGACLSERVKLTRRMCSRKSEDLEISATVQPSFSGPSTRSRSLSTFPAPKNVPQNSGQSTRSRSRSVSSRKSDEKNVEGGRRRRPIEETISTPQQTVPVRRSTRIKKIVDKIPEETRSLKIDEKKPVRSRSISVKPKPVLPAPPTRVRGVSTMPTLRRSSRKSVGQPLPSISPPKKSSESLEFAENSDQIPPARKQTQSESVKCDEQEVVKITENLPSTSTCSVISSAEIPFPDDFLEQSDDEELKIVEEIEEKSPKAVGKLAANFEELGLDISDSDEEPEQPRASSTIFNRKSETKRTAILIDIPLKKGGKGTKRVAKPELSENRKKLRKNQRENGKTNLRLAFDLKLPVEQLPQILEEKGVKLENGCILMEIEEAVDVMIEYLKKSQHAEMWGLLLKQKKEQKTEVLINKEEEVFLNVAATFIQDDGRLLLEFAKRIIYEFTIMNSTSTCSRISASFARLFCHSIYFAEQSLETPEDLEEIAILPQKLLSVIFLRHEQQAGRLFGLFFEFENWPKIRGFAEESFIDRLSIDFVEK
ncbi:unnamed protein product [Caenorhabditis angaria]|uniref:Uncharacterized protein n=1 Tax=Caenorhabditis angaria TaxID=860376 RepID=A0A9P1IAA9_9PELO|nr:unnamed protein product [Caenorhabditis angaria]